MSLNRIVWLGVKLVAAAWMAAAAYAIFFIAPDERTMHAVQRIFYIHVASAWTAGVAYFLVALAGVLYLVRRRPQHEWLGVAAAEVGLAFTTVVLITGPIWAHPVWGIWWTWDARLTTTFVLWLMYVAYLLIRNLVEEPQRRAVVSAIYGIFAFADVPMVYMSITWWRTQHPSRVIGGGQGSGLDPTMKAVLFFTWGATMALFAVMVRQRYRLEAVRIETELLRQEAEELTAESTAVRQGTASA
jgi:heme exporter protein C